MAFGVLSLVYAAVLLFLAVIIFMGHVLPKYTRQQGTPIIENPTNRGKPILIDKDLPGIFGEVKGKVFAYEENGMIPFVFETAEGPICREYSLNDIVPLNASQVLADSGPPVFITKSTKYSQTEFQNDIESSRKRESSAIKEKEMIARELRYAQKSTEQRVKEGVALALESQKYKPAWSGQK